MVVFLPLIELLLICAPLPNRTPAEPSLAEPKILIVPKAVMVEFTATPPIPLEVPIKLTSPPAVILLFTFTASSLADVAFKAVNNTLLGVVIPTWL